MQILAGNLLLSATDLVNFLGCRHATYLDLGDLTDPVRLPERDAAIVLIFEKGLDHERRYLALLKARGLSVVEVPGQVSENVSTGEQSPQAWPTTTRTRLPSASRTGRSVSSSWTKEGSVSSWTAGSATQVCNPNSYTVPGDAEEFIPLPDADKVAYP
jgi:hypothetical protein